MAPKKTLSPVPQLTSNALTVLEKRYLWRDESGAIAETPAQLFERVARAAAIPEGRQRGRWAERYYEMMASCRFMPNSPTLMNAGRPGLHKAQLSACFVLPIGDSLESIFDSLKSAAIIHQSGGGTGFSFSALRAKGRHVRSAHGVASGPVSFIRVFDVATETIKQGGARRGANMAVLRVDHPDIVDFIESKRDLVSITNFNISVGATHEFMRALEAGGEYSLRDPRTGEPSGRLKAKMVFDKITRAAWECGDPGMIFLDRVNLFNPTPSEGAIESTNPCGEQPLLAYESCNLGSLNLGRYLVRQEFDWELFKEDIAAAVRFLDDVVEVNSYPIPECERITLRNRKIGLGVMGFADLLLLMGIPYDAPRARELGEKLMSFLDREAKRASAGLAEARGSFPNWNTSLWKKLGYQPMRNATVSTVAPTGTISIIAGASSGIEPIFSGVFYRNVLSGARLLEVHPVLARALEERGMGPVTSGESLTEEKVSALLGEAWRPAGRVAIEDHIRMQAVFQRHSDSAVSKTVNLPEASTEEDVARAYLLAYSAGCKGITIYRDRSRATQVLERPVPEEKTVCSSC